MRSMFEMGFQKQIFSERHPNLGISISDIEGWWKQNLPTIKQDVKPLTTQTLPGTVPVAPKPVLPPYTPTSSSVGSTMLWVGALGVLGVGAYYLIAKAPFGIKK